jgi:hypothetical protein
MIMADFEWVDRAAGTDRMAAAAEVDNAVKARVSRVGASCVKLGSYIGQFLRS